MSSPKTSSSVSSPDDDTLMVDVDTADAAAAAAELQPSGGVLLAFGCGMFGMLGTDDESNRRVPEVVSALSQRSVCSVTAGSAHSLAVCSDNTLYSWGSNDDGQRGLGDRTPHPLAEVAALQAKVIVASAAGYAHSLALTKAGEVFAFGQGEMAQLGLTLKKRPKGTPPDLSSHATPALVRELAALTRIISISCGENHSLALSSGGRVYAAGDGSRGALGLDLRPAAAPASASGDAGVRVPVFTELTSLLPIPISALAAGAHHSVFVSAGGSVYSCGDATKGRLGYSLASTASSTSGSHAIQWLPRRITTALESKHVLAASAGAQFTLLLTQDYQVYATGNNSHGELGTLSTLTPWTDTPTRIRTLPPIVQLSAGATHALARDASNRVWSWGEGESGELGWSATEEPPKHSSAPGLVALPKLFPNQHVVSVAAGSNTSFIIVAQTIITTTNECRDGTTPTRRATPNSTSAHGASTFQLYSPAVGFSFPSPKASSSSSAASSSLPELALPPCAASPTPQFIVPPLPAPLSLSAFSYSHFSSLVRRKEYVQLTNYVTHCFASALILNASFLPSAAVGGGSFIDCSVLETTYQTILKVSLDFPRLQQALTSSLQKLVSSMVLLLKQARQPPKDLAAYRCVFIAFMSPHLLHATASESQVLSDISYVLTRIPRELTQTRIHDYLYGHISLPIMQRCIRVLIQNVERRLAAPLAGAPPAARLRAPPEDVQDIVSILDGIHTSVQQRYERQQARLLLPPVVDAVPDPEALAIDASDWYVNVQSFIDLPSDLDSFTTTPPTSAQLPPFSFMRYPWLLSPATKVSYLRTEFAGQMQQQVLGAVLSHLPPQLELTVRRSHLIEDTINALNRYSVWELRRPLKVTFVGELGEDAGGLTSEFFELVFQQLFTAQYQLFEVARAWQTYWFSSRPMDPSKKALYECVGMLLGMACFNGASMHLNLPIWFYAQLLGMKPTLAHLKALDPQMASSLEELLRFEGDVENTFCLTWEVTVTERSDEEIDAELAAAVKQNSVNNPYALAPAATTEPNVDHAAPMQVDSGDSSTTAPVTASASPPPRRVRNIPLIPGGADIPVTQANKAAYVAAYVDWLLSSSVREALQPLVDGFQSIVGRVRVGSSKAGAPASSVHSDTASIDLLSPGDLELLCVGRKDHSFSELRRGARYEGWTSDHPTVRAFWSVVLEDLTPAERSRLLVFTTGSSRAPVGGLAEVRMVVQRAGPDSDMLPTSSTCFHALLLPQYSTREKLKEKLKVALDNAVGFGLR